MKAHRIWLLLLLAVLLPVRGALAAAMSCAPAGGATHAQAQVTDPHGAAHPSGNPADHDHSHHHDDGSATAQAECNLCSSVCSAMPLLSSAPSSMGPGDIASAVFPSFSAKSPTFVSGGPERPPRSI